MSTCRFAALALLLVVFATASGTAAPQQPAAPDGSARADGPPVHPTAPPPDAPPPGSRCLGCGVAPEPVDYADRTGWTRIFDGRTLTGWDGNPEVWTVEDGAIVAESWPERRVGGTFIIWRGGEPSDFELKLEVKADYDVHSGIFYRGLVGPAPARGGGRGARGAGPARGGGTGAARGRAAAPMAVPADPRWNVRGYSMDWDYDPGNNGNVQDTAGRTETQLAWRGFIVRTQSGVRPRAIGSLGDRAELMQYVTLGEWNQIHIIARGHQLTHIVNGHVMAVLVDDDPDAFKAGGVIALQIEQFGQGRVSFRDIWLKDLTSP